MWEGGSGCDGQAQNEGRGLSFLPPAIYILYRSLQNAPSDTSETLFLTKTEEEVV